MTGILIVIPAEPGWYPGAKSVRRIGCVGHWVWVSAAGVGELILHPDWRTKCVLHVTRHEMSGDMITPDSVKQQYQEETGQTWTDDLMAQMRRFYKL